MITIRNLSMAYQVGDESIPVLSGIDLDISRGETVAVMGPSGSGKTTLLQLLAGLERPREGSIALDGQPLGEMDADALADLRRDRLGIIFQSFHLIPTLSALDNAALPLEIAGRDGARAAARELLDRVGLAHRERHFPAQLSGGEQQRVAIARALVHNPDLVLADEPTGNLDRATGESVATLLFGLLADHGATLLLATHDATLADRCSRLMRLDSGQLANAA